MDIRTRFVTSFRYLISSTGSPTIKTPSRDVLHTMIGVIIAMIITNFLLWEAHHFTEFTIMGENSPLYEVLLVSPFAASAFLIVMTPFSPLAQPWPVVVGNSVGTAAGLIAVFYIPYPVFMAAIAVGLSVVLMALLRALHPPGAAMALNVVLISLNNSEADMIDLLLIVFTGSVLMVLYGILFGAITKRAYPHKQG